VKTALRDRNILTALLWPPHEHHEACGASVGKEAVDRRVRMLDLT
jgi:hypothetical protein